MRWWRIIGVLAGFELLRGIASSGYERVRGLPASVVQRINDDLRLVLGL